MEFNSLQEVMTYHKIRDSRFIYNDKIFDYKGIDYRDYIPLRFYIIHNKKIKDHYTINGWYLIWYLMSKGNKCYVELNINTICEELSLSEKTIRNILLHLIDINEISVFEKKYSKSTILHIAINYYKEFNDKTFTKGYKPIPKEFVKAVIPTLTANQWSIFCNLVVNYSYFSKANSYNEHKEIVKYNLTTTLYAFPQMIDICASIGISKTTLIKELYGDDRVKSKKFTSLIDNKYNLLKIETGYYNKYIDNKTYEFRSKRENNRYRIELLQRLEYVYHYIWNTEDKRDNKTIKMINSKGFEQIAQTEKQGILNNKDFINYYLDKTMKKYNQWVEIEDKESYLKNKTDYRLEKLF